MEKVQKQLDTQAKKAIQQAAKRMLNNKTSRQIVAEEVAKNKKTRAVVAQEMSDEELVAEMKRRGLERYYAGKEVPPKPEARAKGRPSLALQAWEEFACRGNSLSRVVPWLDSLQNRKSSRTQGKREPVRQAAANGPSWPRP